jgi:hypothetical protein
MRLPVKSVEKGDCDGGDEREEEKERAVEAKPCQNRQSVACALVAGPERHGNASARGQRRGRGSSWSRDCREGRGPLLCGGRREDGEERRGRESAGGGMEPKKRQDDKAWWSENQGRTPKISNRQSSRVNYLPQASYQSRGIFAATC